MALVPPPGLNPPANPQIPPTPADISNAADYVKALTEAKGNSLFQTPAMPHEVGLAEGYKTAVIFAHAPGPNAAPAWLAQIAADIARISSKIDEQPLLLANSRAGLMECLYDPRTAAAVHWQLLVHPNPTTLNQLLHFTQAECALSAANLQLPHLPGHPTVQMRRRQIADRIGVYVG